MCTLCIVCMHAYDTGRRQRCGHDRGGCGMAPSQAKSEEKKEHNNQRRTSPPSNLQPPNPPLTHRHASHCKPPADLHAPSHTSNRSKQRPAHASCMTRASHAPTRAPSTHTAPCAPPDQSRHHRHSPISPATCARPHHPHRHGLSPHALRALRTAPPSPPACEQPRIHSPHLAPSGACQYALAFHPSRRLPCPRVGPRGYGYNVGRGRGGGYGTCKLCSCGWRQFAFDGDTAKAYCAYG